MESKKDKWMNMWIVKRTPVVSTGRVEWVGRKTKGMKMKINGKGRRLVVGGQVRRKVG